MLSCDRLYRTYIRSTQAVAEALGTCEPEPAVEPLAAVEPALEPDLRVYALGTTRVIVGARTLASTD